MDKAWFNLRPEIRRPYARAVWVPLYLFKSGRSGAYPEDGYQEVFEGAHTLAVPMDARTLGEEYTWSSSTECRPWADENFYKTADIYSHSATVDIGFRLVLRQAFGGEHDPVFHVHPDLVIALNLIREGDFWLRPEEGYIEVIRSVRSERGEVVGIEMRSEFLRDYLCARNAALRIATYRERDAILPDLGDIDFTKEGASEDFEGGRLEHRAWPIDTSGSPYGSSVAVFKMSRNDVDPEEDVPVMGRENDQNVDSEQWSFKRQGPQRWRATAEYWRDEWLEPGTRSSRVRGDRIASDVTYIVEADGTRVSADDLNDEDIGRWLWFKADVVSALLAQRGTSLSWYTRHTGGLASPSESPIHFGVNDSCLINVYAYDIARLPEWLRRMWGGFNVTPEGRVCSELLDSQVRSEPAKTKAPERYLGTALDSINDAWIGRYGTPLLRVHHDRAATLAAAHRFRASDRTGLLSLAKDLARLTADSIDKTVAQAAGGLPKGDTRGSLKSLEAALAKLCGDEMAHKTLGPLFSIYDLRLADAHPARSDLLDAFSSLGIVESDPWLVAGYKILHATVGSLAQIGRIVEGAS